MLSSPQPPVEFQHTTDYGAVLNALREKLVELGGTYSFSDSEVDLLRAILKQHGIKLNHTDRFDELLVLLIQSF